MATDAPPKSNVYTVAVNPIKSTITGIEDIIGKAFVPTTPYRWWILLNHKNAPRPTSATLVVAMTAIVWATACLALNAQLFWLVGTFIKQSSSMITLNASMVMQLQLRRQASLWLVHLNVQLVSQTTELASFQLAHQSTPTALRLSFPTATALIAFVRLSHRLLHQAGLLQSL